MCSNPEGLPSSISLAISDLRVFRLTDSSLYVRLSDAGRSGDVADDVTRKSSIELHDRMPDATSAQKPEACSQLMAKRSAFPHLTFVKGIGFSKSKSGRTDLFNKPLAVT